MNEEDKIKLVDAWILAQETEDDDARAITAMGDISQWEPELAWDLILRIHAKPLTDEVREMLVASPLEDLLVYHGAAVFPRVKEVALRDPLFRGMLKGVWLDVKVSPIWREFYELAGVAPPGKGK
jgi:hypothetical protein